MRGREREREREREGVGAEVWPLAYWVLLLYKSDQTRRLYRYELMKNTHTFLHFWDESFSNSAFFSHTIW